MMRGDGRLPFRKLMEAPSIARGGRKKNQRIR